MSERENILKPSEERVWEKYYAEDAARQLQTSMPEGSLWNALIEPALRQAGDQYDALVYFGNHISRSQLIAHVERLARVLRGMGLGPDDQVLLFAPILPEAIYVMFAANKIGATVLMPNLGASHQALEHSIDQAKVAFIFDELEAPIADILARPQFRHVVLLSAASSMAAPLATILSAINFFKLRTVRRRPKYITLSQAIRQYDSYQGQLDATYDENRPAMVFSSGGTTKEGTAKLIVMTDKAMINMFRCALAYNLGTNPFRQGYKSLTLVPPFVCTGFFVLVLAPLYRGMTVYIDPRLDQEHFNQAMHKFSPQITLVSGCLWAGFFRDVEQRMSKGQKIDLGHFALPIMGGEGCTPETLQWMDDIAFKAGSPLGIVSGYGMSEAFSVITIDYRPALRNKRDEHQAISVGYPFPGFTVGIFDRQGNELPYGQRGELRAKTPTMMQGYLNNTELTQAVIGDGWIHSGDLAEMTPDGIVHVYGRMHEYIKSDDGREVYLFDIANRLRQDEAVKETLVVLAGDYANRNIVAHLILQDNNQEPIYDLLQRLDDDLRQWLPSDVQVKGFQLHQGIFKVSLITKVNKNYYSHLLDGYCKPQNGSLVPVSFPN